MTYTILGFCERTGQLGMGVATYSLAVGSLCPAIVSNAGVLTAQSNLNPEMRTLGASLLAAGASAAHTCASLVQADSHPDYRQFGVLDIYGRGAAATGSQTRPWTGHRITPNCVALGNVLDGEQVVAAMEAAFHESEAESLSERLLRALEAGRDAGGQVGSRGHVTERSAYLVVHGRAPVAELDLRVDSHPDAVTAMRELHDEFQPYLAFHRQRHLDPASAPPQEAFVAGLNRSAAS